ncbi:MAG: TIGR04552 family protein [Proteobacteria bacterium]|nr:TIGR04552 family protein [Pseudomonadota bacterium]NDG27437.1 TIGR04552 family protein [Pseudomonadota bacterium]
MTAIPNLDFPWSTLKVPLDGTSVLDVPRLKLRTMEEATSFVLAYGFDPTNKSDLTILWDFFDEAVQFLEKTLTDPEYPRVPEHLRSRDAVKDIRRLLLMASGELGSVEQRFCCAILRIMHGLIHLYYDPRHKFFQQMQTQVLARLDKCLHVDPNTGVTSLGRGVEGEEGIKLLFFKKKERKDKSREMIKLLHKAESVVEEIYDRVGIRLVTETKLEALRAVTLLIEKNIISLPNIRPARSRNRLIDIQRLKFELERISTHLKKTTETQPYVKKMIARLESRIGTKRLGRSLLNPHSSEHYRAIQFTCRELVRVPNPQNKIYQAIQSHFESIPGGSQLLQELFPSTPPTHDFGFFPYEVQVMDVKAYADSVFGKSNHEEYRRKQLDAARRRVFGRELSAND